MEKDEMVCRSEYPPRLRYPDPYAFRPDYKPTPPIVYPVDPPPNYYCAGHIPYNPYPWPSEPRPHPWVDPQWDGICYMGACNSGRRSCSA